MAFCDIEEYPRKVLQKHWPHVKQYKDIKELNYDRLKAEGLVPIDIITGGYPCQPFSVAGRKKGEEDPRHLWPEYFRLVQELRPTWVIGENVSGHIKLGLDTVLQDLESEGYTSRTFNISAASVGANHKRERVWIVAHSERNDNFNKEQRVDGEEKEIPRERGENDSTPRESSRTSTVRQTNNTHVANTESDTKDGVLRTASSKSDQGNPRMEFAGSRDGQPKREAPQTMANTQSNRLFSSSGEIRGGNTDRLFRDTEENRNEVWSEVGGRRGLSGTEDMANTNSEGLERQWKSRNQFGSEFTATESGEERQGEMGQGWWSVEPNVGRVAHGIPKRVDRLKSLGNSLIPQIPYYLGTVILKVMNEKTN